MSQHHPVVGPVRRLHRHWPFWAFVIVIAVLVLFARAAAAGARATVLGEGRQDFEESCVACHGGDATGTGTLATKLVKPPKDLTQIAVRNGGTFPFWQVFEIIAGEKPVAGHDTHQMPQFMADMTVQERKPGFAPAHVRVLELTHYLESLQRK
jgi:mono/diheme cytochrome c family protein